MTHTPEEREKHLEYQRNYRRKSKEELHKASEAGLDLTSDRIEAAQWEDVNLLADLKQRIIKYNHIARSVQMLSYQHDVYAPIAIVPEGWDGRTRPRGVLKRLTDLLEKVDLMDLNSVDWTKTAASTNQSWVAWCDAVHFAHMACKGFKTTKGEYGEFHYEPSEPVAASDVGEADETSQVESSAPTEPLDNGETHQVPLAEPDRRVLEHFTTSLTVILERYQALNIKVLELEAQYKALDSKVKALQRS